MRRFGGIPSRYYLLYTPFAFTLIWLLILVTVSGSYLLSFLSP
jgi:hypothetical protein